MEYELSRKRIMSPEMHWFRKIKVHLGEGNHDFEIIGVYGRERFGSVTKSMNDIMWSPLTLGGWKWHGDFLVKSKNMGVAFEFCNRNKFELGELAKLTSYPQSKRIIINAGVRGGSFEMYFNFCVYGDEEKKVRGALGLAAAIARREG